MGTRKLSRLWNRFTGQKKRRPYRWQPTFASLRLELLEDRLAPAVTATLDAGHFLNVNLNADGDAATISDVGSNIQVANGANAVVFSGLAASIAGIKAQGTFASGAGITESV